MTIGAMVSLNSNVESGFCELHEIGLSYCQLCGWEDSLYTRKIADRVLAITKNKGITITAFWCGWPGPKVWDFYEGPLTLGLTPPDYRFARMEVLKKGSDFARMLGVNKLATHAGFIPENPADPNYAPLIAALRDVVCHCKSNGQAFLFETGQETPVTLRRAIEDLGSEGSFCLGCLL